MKTKYAVKIIYRLVFLVLLILCSCFYINGQPDNNEERIVVETLNKGDRQFKVRRGQGLLRLSEPLSPAQIEEIETRFRTNPEGPFPVKVIRISDKNIYLFKSLNKGTAADLFRMFDQVFKQQPGLLIINRNLEPDFIAYLDPQPKSAAVADGLWGVRRIGVDAVWNTYQVNGNRNIVVAVLDGGILSTHLDLRPNLWTSPRPYTIYGVNCPAGSHGFNFLGAASSDACIATDTSNYGHGTRVAGIIGAVEHTVAGNDGVKGVMQQVSLMSVKIFDVAGITSVSEAVKGLSFIRYMKGLFGDKQQIRIVNISAVFDPDLPSPDDWASFRTEMAAADMAGLMIIAAAGNEGVNINPDPKTCFIYPACFSLAHMIAVSASTRNEMIYSLSNWGARTIHVAAPGEPVNTTGKTNSDFHGSISKTSAAVPFVSGSAGLLLAACPLLTNTEVKRLLLEFSNRGFNGIKGKVLYGRLDVYAAIQKCRSPGFKTYLSFSDAVPGDYFDPESRQSR